jgi:hypothetical protein
MPMHNSPTVADIQAVVCNHFGTNRAEMCSLRLHRSASHPRQLAMYLSYELTELSNAEIARLFGGRDHTTIIYGRRVVAQRLAEDNVFASHVSAIRAEILARAKEARPCACADCVAREVRFPFDPPQLVLPVVWPGELPLQQDLAA